MSRRESKHVKRSKERKAAQHSPLHPTSHHGVHYSILRELANDRIDEAEILLKKKYYSGAAYIVGYGVEFLLKAIISYKHNAGRWQFRDLDANLKTHNLQLLLKHAGLYEQMRSAEASNLHLVENWQVIRTWDTQLRYLRLKERRAKDMVNAVANPQDGVARWLQLWLS